MNEPSAAAHEIARRLLVREQFNASSSTDLGAAAEEISARLRTVLVRWIGADASHAVIQRALEDVKPNYSGLIGARCEAGRVVGVATNGIVHDPAAVTEGFTALVGALVDRLGRVVGEEMALRLVEQAQSPGGDGSRPVS